MLQLDPRVARVLIARRGDALKVDRSPLCVARDFVNESIALDYAAKFFSTIE
jgi:hypothetical protein